jgi:hypothetical protein
MSAAPLFIPSEIVIHHSACHDSSELQWDGIRMWHKSLGWLDIGYSAGTELIGLSYEVLMGRSWDMIGAHTLGHNDKALGFCFVGDFTKDAPPQGQLIVGARFIAFWMRLYRIDIANIFKHSALNATACPGAAFPWDAFIDLVKAAS